MHDHIDESSNDVHFSYWYEDYQTHKNVWFSNWFEDHLSRMLSDQFEDRESCCRFELKISSSLRFESEISLFDLNECIKFFSRKNSIDWSFFKQHIDQIIKIKTQTIHVD
jgi:hypothetical protein